MITHRLAKFLDQVQGFIYWVLLMNVNLQRKIDQVIGVLICRILSVFNRKRQRVVASPNTRRILVILLSEMGSLVLAHPMLQLLKSRYPKASISVLQFKKNREILEIMDVVPHENIYTIDPSSAVTLFKDIVKVVIQLRRQRFDVSIDCELFHRISSILSFLSAAPVRVGFHRHTQEEAGEQMAHTNQISNSGCQKN